MHLFLSVSIVEFAHVNICWNIILNKMICYWSIKKNVLISIEYRSIRLILHHKFSSKKITTLCYVCNCNVLDSHFHWGNPTQLRQGSTQLKQGSVLAKSPNFLYFLVVFLKILLTPSCQGLAVIKYFSQRHKRPSGAVINIQNFH